MKTKLSPRQDVARRLKIASGHLNKTIEMVEDGVYCVDVLQQTSAVRSAIKKAEEVLLSNHINSCVSNAMNTKGQDKAVKELIELYKKVD